MMMTHTLSGARTDVHVIEPSIKRAAAHGVGSVTMYCVFQDGCPGK